MSLSAYFLFFLYSQIFMHAHMYYPCALSCAGVVIHAMISSEHTKRCSGAQTRYPTLTVFHPCIRYSAITLLYPQPFLGYQKLDPVSPRSCRTVCHRRLQRRMHYQWHDESTTILFQIIYIHTHIAEYISGAIKLCRSTSSNECM